MDQQIYNYLRNNMMPVMEQMNTRMATIIGHIDGVESTLTSIGNTLTNIWNTLSEFSMFFVFFALLWWSLCMLNSKLLQR